MARSCPSCNVVLVPAEVQRGVCPECGATLGLPTTAERPAAIVSHEPLPPGPPDSLDEPGPATRAMKLLLTTLFVLTLGSFFLPFGVVPSIYAGVYKGSSVCACPGCSQPATEFRPADAASPAGNELVGFCKPHFVLAPRNVPANKASWVANLIAGFFLVVPVVYLVWFVTALIAVYRETANSVPLFLLCLVVGLVVVNLFSYGYWHFLHWNLQHPG